MRDTKSANGITVKAYAGTTGVLLAFNVTNARRTGLLGFSIERKDPKTKKWEWLTGMLPFPSQQHDPGQPIPTDLSPVQKFRWSDYRVHAETTYSYRVSGRYGKPTDQAPDLELVQGPEVEITTSSNDENGVHNILFNRAAGGSQAFSRNFPAAVALCEEKRKSGGISKLTVEDLDKASPGCKAWLTRGVLPKILDTIARAKDATWALDIAIYEYEWHEIVEAVNAASQRGVQLRLIYHAKKAKDPKDKTKVNAKNAKPLVQKGQARARLTTAIFHDKFIVLSKVSKSGNVLTRKPVTVLCGSTNFTHNGLFRQANVVHVVQTKKGEDTNPTAEKYETLFEMLWNGKEPEVTDVTGTKDWIDANNKMDKLSPLFAGFSPRRKQTDLARFIEIINSAKQDVLFATAFVLPKQIVAALMGQPNDPILRLGVQDTDANGIAGFHRDRTAQFAATALFDHGFEGWLKEAMIPGGGNILIHTKAVVVDFTGDSPVVISGSHNLSVPASEKNDENYLIIQGNPDLADSYGVEVMRIYDHYRARWVQDQIQKGKLPGGGKLQPDDKWTDRYFKKNSLHFRDRLRFVGA
ncbi:MAG TPA: phospholipase D-like domain-containing protein [Candidatus Acidoferrales bacterium]|jgi:phosphatidylserine/phosphatidylglycerophosphate/cardiolipin synthase-like enzyme|nr:phospholipase D-like domain-containing protein [Candidatus Acidoferrales bacterium]